MHHEIPETGETHIVIRAAYRIANVEKVRDVLLSSDASSYLWNMIEHQIGINCSLEEDADAELQCQLDDDNEILNELQNALVSLKEQD